MSKASYKNCMPCPFCGERENLGVNQQSGSKHHSFFAVDCWSCRFTGPGDPTHKGALDKWNCRANPFDFIPYEDFYDREPR